MSAAAPADDGARLVRNSSCKPSYTNSAVNGNMQKQKGQY